MNTTSRAGWLAIAFLCVTSPIFAQTVAEDLRRADKQFDLYAYNLAMKTYQQVLAKDANNGHALARIGDCHFQLNQTEESLSWYERAVQQRELDSDVQLRYGKALMLKGDYAQAKRQFQEYAVQNDETTVVGRHYAEMCDYAIKNAKKDPLYTAKNEPLNTEASDFGAALLNNRVVYSSARTDMTRKTQSKTSSDWSGSAYNQLFVTQRNPETSMLQKPSFLRSDLQNNYNEGSASFSADGKRVAFCRNNFINGTRQIADKGLSMSIYIADVVDGEWVNAQPFPFNGSDFATGFPSLSANGNTLIFSSNNPNSTTGGKGWDIYVSNFVSGEWNTPRNLGAPLNTPGNEVTPFYDGTYLYFSSDWHNGLGGLDVFRAEIGKTEVSNIFHLGPGINSSYDDYGFVFNNQQKVGYITSTRPGGRGGEDIWQIVKKSSDGASSPNTSSSRSLTNVMSGGRSGTAGNQGTSSSNDVFKPSQYSTENEWSIKNYYLVLMDSWGNPIAGADVDFSECNNEKGQTDTEGKYYFSASRPIDCAIGIGKKGYEGARVDIKEFGAHNITVNISPDKRQEFVGKVLDARTTTPINGAVVEFQDGGKPIQTTTATDGTYALLLTPRSTYSIEYSSEGYRVAKASIRPGMPEMGNTIADVLLESVAGSQPSDNSFSGRSNQPNFNSQPNQYSSSNPSISGRSNQPNTSSQPNADTQPNQYANTNNPSPQSGRNNSSTITLITQQPNLESEFNGYSIQLSAAPKDVTEADSKKYESLAKHGNLYSKLDGNVNKVRLGIYPTKPEAQKILKEVNKDARFKGAFVVEERGAGKDLMLGGKQQGTAPAQYGLTSSSKSGSPTANSNVCYAVQLGSFSADKPLPISDFTSLSNLGKLYSKSENDMLKMRLGVWQEYSEAEKAQEEAVKRGFKDALVVTEKTTDESIKPFLVPVKTPLPASGNSSSRSLQGSGSKSSTSATTPTQYSNSNTKSGSGVKYYVRLCALSDPNRFDTGKLEGAGVNGKVEKWPVTDKPELTAIMLAGYATLDAAKSDKEKVRTNGFPEAYVVKQENGKLTTVK